MPAQTMATTLRLFTATVRENRAHMKAAHIMKVPACPEKTQVMKCPERMRARAPTKAAFALSPMTVRKA